MKLNVIDDPSLVHEYLNLACSLNSPADVRIFKGKIAHTYKSRLYDISEHAGKRCVVIDIPTEEGHFVALPRRSEVEIYFAAKSERFLFEARVLGKSTFALAASKVPVLLISYPKVLENSQRRAYYRVCPPSSKPVPVRMTTFKHKKDGKWTYEERLEAVRAQLMNISAGGIAARVPREQSKDIDIATRLKLAFKLETETDEIKLMGMVRHNREDLVDRTMKILGIQFVDLEQSPEDRYYIDRIFAYVAEIQREELAVTRGGSQSKGETR